MWMRRKWALSLVAGAGLLASTASAQQPAYPYRYPTPNQDLLPYPYMPYPAAAFPAPVPQAPLPPDYDQLPAFRVVPAQTQPIPAAGLATAVRPASASDSASPSIPGGAAVAQPLPNQPLPNQPVEPRQLAQPMREVTPAPSSVLAPAVGPNETKPWWDETPQGKHCVVTGGFGFYYLKPHFDTNPAFAKAINVPSVTAASTTTTQENFNWDYSAAPLVWLEVGSSCGLGVRGRYWRFDDTPNSPLVSNPFSTGASTTQVTSAFPLGLGIISNPGGVGTGFNDTLLFGSSLKMDVVDLEVTKRFRPGGATIAVAGGIRYARIAQTYNASLLSIPAITEASTVQSNLTSSHDFHGVGGTLALEVAYPCGCTGLSLFVNGRGSLLYGTGNEAASLGTVTRDPGGFITTQTLAASTTQDRLLPVAEIELGAEYGRRLGRGFWFVQTALVDQVWFGAGNASNNETITGTGTVLTVPATQTADNHINLGMFGLRVALGFRY